jgi:hypothetical protein
MFSRRARALLLTLTGVLACLGGGVGRASTDGADGAHWDVPEVLVRDETGHPDVGRALERAVAAWNEATPRLQLRVVPGEGSGCRGADGEIQVCLTSGEAYAGSATTVEEDGHIASAVVLLELDRVGAYVDAVACHELGHAVGLDHRSSGDTCMRERPTVAEPDDEDLRRVRDSHADHHCERRSVASVDGRCFGTLP